MTPCYFIMYEVPDSLRTLPDYSEYSCDICNKEFGDSIPYAMLGDNNGVSLCQECYARDTIVAVREDYHGRVCDICKKDLQSPAWAIGYHFDSCDSCLPQVRNVFIELTPENTKKLIYNERGYIYLFDEPEPDRFEIPKELKSRLLYDDYVELMDSLVRPPTLMSNLAEWVMIEPFSDVPTFIAECGLAVRCIKGEHQVASVLMDGHGRIAMNIVYNNVEDFLAAEAQFKSQVLSGNEDRSQHEDELIMRATDSFAVYIRIEKNLCLNYG